MRLTKADIHALDVPDDANIGLHFSQFGEDLITWHYLRRIWDGFYVDIGAHHPYRLSNTYLLHRRRRWRGINVDLDDRAIDAFRTHRPNDVSLNAVVSDREHEVDVTIFEDGAINSADAARSGGIAPRFSVRKTEKRQTTTLKALLDTHLPPDRRIDLLSVDVEGLDASVLRGNDWSRYRPGAILVEVHKLDLSAPEASETYTLLRGLGYRLVSHAVVTSFFMSQ